MTIAIAAALALQPFEEKKLGSLPEGTWTAAIHPKTMELAYVEPAVKGLVVVYRGEKSEPYDGVGGPLFAPDGTMVYSAEKGGKEFFVVGGRKLKQYDDVGRLVFKPGGGLAFEAYVKDRGRFAVIDEQEGESFYLIGAVVFGPDGRSFSYSAKTKEGRAYLVTNGMKSQGFEDVHEPVYTPDGRSVVAKVKQGGKWHLLTDGKLGPAHEWISHPLMLSDGTVVCSIKKGGKETVMIGDRAGDPFDQIGAMTVRGKAVAYEGAADGKWWLVHGGKKREVSIQAQALLLSEDGRSVARWGNDMKSFFVEHDGKRGPDVWSVERVTLSPDGKAVAYVTDAGLVVGSRTHKNYDAFIDGPHFSPDGKKVAYAGLSGRDVWWRVVAVEP
jgi:hypothetical protein